MEKTNAIALVGLDTAPLIYLIEQNPIYLELVRSFFRGMNQGEFSVVTSTVTVTEVLVYPLRAGNPELAQQYRDILFNQDNLTCQPTESTSSYRCSTGRNPRAFTPGRMSILLQFLQSLLN